MSFLINAAWFTFGLGFVPSLVLLAVGLLLRLPFPSTGSHLLRLAGRLATPRGTRICNYEGKGALRALPLLGLTTLLELAGDDLSAFEGPPRGAANSVDALDIVALLIWEVTIGGWLALFHLIAGILLCLSLVGVVFGVRHFALIPVALLPLQYQALRAGEAPWPLPELELGR